MISFPGIIPAGFPSPAEEELADNITLDDYLITNRASSFLIKVDNNSLNPYGIYRGDLLIIERGRKVLPDDIVLAQIEEEWKLTPFFLINGQEIIINGVVVGVVRKYH